MRFSFAVVVLACGCGPAVGSAPSEPAERAAGPAAPVRPASQAPASAGESVHDGCVPFVEAPVVAEAYARGVAKLAESVDGEHRRAEPFETAVGALKVAATSGHLEAQSLYGRTVFGARFTVRAPVPAEKEDYVSAIAFLRIAAKSGDDAAADYMPGLTLPRPPDAPPLNSLPAGWAVEAFDRADAWITCHGLPEAS